MKTVFVSGAYDVVHAGHVAFFKMARALGDRLVVCVPTDEVFTIYKGRYPCFTQLHKVAVISCLSGVDEVVVGGDKCTQGLNFETEFRRIKPDILAVTEDDKFAKAKRLLCRETGTEYVVLKKVTGGDYDLCATDFAKRVSIPYRVPLRVDFAGGWLDVPSMSRNGAYIVNCAISPCVSVGDWCYRKCGGLGGSAAFALLSGSDCVKRELESGVGWQDPAIIQETGLCVWRSGPQPILEAKVNPDFLNGKMALHWTGSDHNTAEICKRRHNLDAIEKAGAHAANCVKRIGMAARDRLRELADSVTMSYKAQLSEGMKPLRDAGELGKKYCGSGFGGYALYIFETHQERDNSGMKPIEPFQRQFR